MTTLQSPIRSDSESSTGAPIPATLPGNPREHRRAMQQDPIAFLMRCAEAGPIVRLQLDRPSWLLTDVQDIRHVLSQNPLNYLKEQTGISWLRGIFGRSLPFLEGAEHRSMRKQMQPHFRPRALHEVPAVTWREARAMTESWEDGQELDVGGALRQMTLSVSGRLMLGVEPTEAAQVYRRIQDLHRRITEAMPGPVAWRSPWPRWLPSRKWRRMRREEARLDEAVLHVVRQRQQQSLDGDDVISSLLRQRAAGEINVTDHEIRDHACNLLLAGSDPIVYGLGWTLCYLAEAPELDEAVAAESRDLLGDREPTMNDLSQLEQCRRTLTEGLRLRPTTWMIEREPVEDETLPSGVTVKAGQRLMISSFVLHRRPALYPDPERFDPSRFASDVAKQRSPYAYIPFGAGARSCIGQHLAMAIGTLTLAWLAPRFRFERISDDVMTYVTRNSFTIQTPDGRLPLRVRHR